MLQEGAQVEVRFFFIADFEFNTLYVYMSAQPLPIGASGMGKDVTNVTLLPWKLLYLTGKV